MPGGPNHLKVVAEMLKERSMCAGDIARSLTTRFKYPPNAMALGYKLRRDPRFEVKGRDERYRRLWGLVVVGEDGVKAFTRANVEYIEGEADDR